MKPKFRTLKQQKLDGELGLIIDEMGRAMWNANKTYIASRPTYTHLTLRMYEALERFHEYCKKYYGK